MLQDRLATRVLEIGERMAAKLPNGTPAVPEKARYANARLVLEFATTFLATPQGAALGPKLMPRVLALAAESSCAANKTEKRAALAAVFNCSVLLLQAPQEGLTEPCLAALHPYFKAEVHACLKAAMFAADPVALESAIAAAGNLLLGRRGATVELVQDLAQLRGFMPGAGAATELLAELVAGLQ